MKIYFFDTETTGNTGKDYLCQIAIKERGVETPVLNGLFKPPVPISHEASGVHHITNKMVADKPLFAESSEYASTKALFENPEHIFVAHNCGFDVGILKSDNIVPAKTICTLKVIRRIDTNKTFTNYKLQYLRYALGMELDVGAHDAMADVLVLERVFEYLLQRTMTEHSLDEAGALALMQQITSEPTILKDFTFGKYNGKSIAEVAATDPGYLQWLYSQKKQSDKDETDWLYTLEQYIKV